MPERDFNAPTNGENSMPESEGMRSATPPPLQLSANPVDPPKGGAGNFPWLGIVRDDAWSSGFYSFPNHESKTADIPKGTKIRAMGQSGGWLQVEILSGEHKGEQGYISQERVENLESKQPEKQAEPYSDEINAGEEIAAIGGKVSLEGDANGALFYAKEGDRIFVVPADKVAAGNQEVEYQTLFHSFQDRGASGFTTLYLTRPGDNEYAPIHWYAQASQQGMIDIWGALLEEFGQLIEGMKSPEWNPGKQPPNFYIGNAAHKAIAAQYSAIHEETVQKTVSQLRR